MKNNYILNNYLFSNLSDWGLQQKDLATCIGKSEQAMSMAIANNSFTMWDISKMAYDCMFTGGSFILQSGLEPKHMVRTNGHRKSACRLQLLVYDGIRTYGTQKALSEATGITEGRLRTMKKVIEDKAFGTITDPKVLDKIMFRDVLTILSHVDNVNFWRYFVGTELSFPVTDDMEHQMVPIETYLLIEADRDAILKQAASAKENMDTVHAETCKELKEVKKECKDLKLQLKEANRGNEAKLSVISSLRTENSNIRQDYQDFVNNIEFYIGSIEEQVPDNSLAKYIKGIKDCIEDANNAFDKEKEKQKK